MKPPWQRLVERAPAILAAGVDQPVPSPCNSICRMDPVTGWCEGCLRDIDEIAAWAQLPQSRRRAVWAQLPERARRARGEPVAPHQVGQS